MSFQNHSSPSGNFEQQIHSMRRPLDIQRKKTFSQIIFFFAAMQDNI